MWIDDEQVTQVRFPLHGTGRPTSEDAASDTDNGVTDADDNGAAEGDGVTGDEAAENDTEQGSAEAGHGPADDLTELTIEYRDLGADVTIDLPEDDEVEDVPFAQVRDLLAPLLVDRFDAGAGTPGERGDDRDGDTDAFSDEDDRVDDEDDMDEGASG